MKDTDILALLRSQSIKGGPQCLFCSDKVAPILNQIVEVAAKSQDLVSVPGMFRVLKTLYEQEHATPFPQRTESGLRSHFDHHTPEDFARVNLIRRGTQN